MARRNGVFAAVKAELDKAELVDSPLGRTVLVLGQRLDDPESPATAVAAMAKELRVALEALGVGAAKVDTPLDELRRKRQERQKGA